MCVYFSRFLILAAASFTELHSRTRTSGFRKLQPVLTYHKHSLCSLTVKCKVVIFTLWHEKTSSVSRGVSLCCFHSGASLCYDIKFCPAPYFHLSPKKSTKNLHVRPKVYIFPLNSKTQFSAICKWEGTSWLVSVFYIQFVTWKGTDNSTERATRQEETEGSVFTTTDWRKEPRESFKQ